MIRFACPGCRSILSGQDEQAGRIVTCPKCGQRMHMPRKPEPVRPTPRRSLWGWFVLVVVLIFLGSGLGLWRAMHKPESEPIRAATVRERSVPPPVPEGAATVRERSVPAPASAPEKPPLRAATVRERSVPPLPYRRGSDLLPPVANSPRLSVEEKKEIDLGEDLPPELPFDLVDAINAQRAKAGVEPIFLDGEVSRACQSRAEKLARRAAPLDGQKKSEAMAAPLEAVEKWLQEPAQRAAVLEPRLRTFGAGYARNVDGQWFSVFDWKSRLDRESPLDAAPVTGAIVYPAPGQMRVPLWFPGNETPDPLPQTKDKLAGYPITITFPSGTRIEEADAHLSNRQKNDVPVWLSSPEKPANPQVGGGQQHTICLIPRKPLLPNVYYQVQVSAKINGTAWSAKWAFVTVSEGELHHEMAGSFLRTLNRLRRHAGLPPVPLDAEHSKACQAHIRYLTQNVPTHPTLNWNSEEPALPGYTAEGAALARTASIQGGGGSAEAVAGLIDSTISRPQLLHPRLHDLGLGYTPFIRGGWLWVVDMHRAPLRAETMAEESNKEYFYPAPDQENVPLIYPPNEVPSPIPADHKGQTAGYAITALFSPAAHVKSATAKLVDAKGNDVDGWVSSPEHPAIAGFPQYLVCLLPKAPLRPGTRYTATFQAEVNGRPWRRTWRFTTQQAQDRYADDLDEKILVQVNAVRKAAGLPLVRFDAELSRACQSHAHYLTVNHHRTAAQGLGVHREDATLPGATPEGARAARESVIAVMLDPQSCVENWMATLYHRIPILRPDLERIGFGHARVQGRKWACVLDTGNGRAPRSRDR